METRCPGVAARPSVHRIGRTGRAGNVGVATGFFNISSNQNIAKELADMLQETNQEVPEFLSRFRGGRSGSSYGGGRGRGRGGYGGRDYRSSSSGSSFGSRSSSS